jgi:hypothetical protein
MNRSRNDLSKKSLQISIGLLALAPLVSGIAGLKGIYNPLFSRDLPVDKILDSNLRFLNGVSIGLSLAVYAVIPNIEKEVLAFRIICAAIFLGGLGRLLSISELGIPSLPFPILVVIELLSPPILVCWQYSICATPVQKE